MPSVIMKELPASITLLSDGQLFEKLQSYNIDVGPILPTTRGVYQRKLFALETGQKVQSYSEFPPADSDDQDDEEQEDEMVLPKVPVEKPQPSPRSKVGERGADEVERRRAIGKPSPRKPLHPEMGDYFLDRDASKSKKRPTAAKSKNDGPSPAGGPRLPVPLWVLVMVGVIIIIFIALILKNMEFEPDTSIPDEIEMNV